MRSGHFTTTNYLGTSEYVFSYLDSFYSGFAKVLFDFYVDLDITGIAGSIKGVINLERVHIKGIN